MIHVPSRRSLRLAAIVTAAALLSAACGGDDDDAAGAADTDAAAATDTTDATDTAGGDPATSDPATTTASASSTDGTASTNESAGSASFASMDEITALCPADEAPDSITFSAWEGQEELIDPAFDDFTEATGIDIEWMANDLGDRLTKIAAEKGSPTIDVAIVPVNEVPALYERGLVEETDTSIPNYDQLRDVAKIDGGYGSSVIQFGIAYNPDKVDKPTSWHDLFDPEYAGHVAFTSMPNSGGYATLAILTRLEGGDDSDLSPGIQRIAEHTDDIHSFFPYSAAIEPQIVSGDVWMIPEIGGAAMAMIDRGAPIEFTVPEEGGPAGMNVLVIPVGNDDLDCIKAFVSYFLGEQVQDAWSKKLYYGSVSTAYEVPDGLTVYPNDYSTVVELDWPTIAANGPETLDLWNREVVG